MLRKYRIIKEADTYTIEERYGLFSWRVTAVELDTRFDNDIFVPIKFNSLYSAKIWLKEHIAYLKQIELEKFNSKNARSYRLITYFDKEGNSV